VNIKVKSLPGCTKEIDVEVPADQVRVEVEALYERIAKEAKLAGFRKGKAPLPIVKQRFKDSVKEEVTHDILPKFFRTVLEKEDIHPVSQPRIKEYQFTEGASMTFTALVEVQPDVALKNYKGLKIQKELVEVTAQDVDQALENVRDQMAQFIPVDKRAVAKNDLALIDFEGRVGGTPFEGGKAEKYPVSVGSGNMIPGFEDQLVGISKGEKKVFNVKFPADYPKKELAGQDAEFTVTVQEIKEKKLPALDDDFAKEVAQCDTVVSLKEKVQVQLKADRENEQRSKMIEQLVDRLLKDHEFEVPESWVAVESRQMIQEGIQRLRQNHVEPNQWTEEQKKEYMEGMRKQADRNVKMAILVDRIAEVEKISCEPADWDSYLEKIAASSNQPVESIKQYVKKQNNEDSLKSRIRHEKALDFLLDASKVEAK